MKDSKNVLKILKSNSVTFESAPPLEIVGLGLETWSTHEFVLLFWGLIPAPMSGGSHQPLIPAPRDPCPLLTATGACAHTVPTPTRTYMHNLIFF